MVALALDGVATITDEIIDLHNRIVGKLFNAAKHKHKHKHKHQQPFQDAGKTINEKVRLYGRIGQALRDAKQSGTDPFAAIETVMPWDEFAASVSQAEQPARPEVTISRPLRTVRPGCVRSDVRSAAAQRLH